MKRMYVGNLPYSSSEDDVRELFSQYGDVGDVNVVRDRETGKSRGFGFVEMGQDQADEAMSNLDGSKFGGRTLKVNEAKPRQ
ncbi:MAG: RNA-binding protein [Desulfohalobiaceae bacterium]|nr:RNA-binding protein [Desulfohalobiaceae bacterium]